MQFTPHIRIHTTHYPGYGSPPSWTVRAIFENTLLEEGRTGSEMDAGRLEERFLGKWQREWNKLTFHTLIQGCPKASRECAHCGLDTIDRSVGCYDRVWCWRCEDAGIGEAERATIKTENERRAAEWQQRRQDEELAREQERDRRLEDIRTGFHWRDGWFFKRQPDGLVRVSRIGRALRRDDVLTEITIPEGEWASIVCSVSSQGETGERWEEARRFHNLKP